MGPMSRLVWAATWLLWFGCQQVDTGVLQGGPKPAPRATAGGDHHLVTVDLPPERQTLRLGLAPFLGGAAIEAQFTPVTEYVASQLGVGVELIITDSYEDLIDRAARAEVELALLPPYSYVLARRRQPNLRLLASIINLGRTYYSSFILVRADDPATTPKDLVGRRFAFVDKASTSGYLFPYAAFQDHGVDPEQDMEVVFAGSHDRALELLSTGQVDGTATSSEVLGPYRRGEQRSERITPGRVRILYKAGRIPYDALCATSALPESGLDRITGAFLSMHHRNPQAREAMDATLTITGWAPPDDHRYDDVRRVLERADARRRPASKGTP